MEEMCSDAEDDRFPSDEEGEHNVERIVLCWFAHHDCSPPLQGFLHGEELGKVALPCHFFVGRDLPLSGLSRSLFLEFSDLWSMCPLLQHFF